MGIYGYPGSDSLGGTDIMQLVRNPESRGCVNDIRVKNQHPTITAIS